MMKITLKIIIATTCLAFGSAVLAVPFNSFDPRSMAMGGAGVAVGDASMAPFFNPALLTITPEEDDFSIDLPIVGVRTYDPADFTNSLDNFQNGNYVNNLDTSISAYNANQTSANLTSVTSSISRLSTELSSLSDKPLQGELGAGLVVGIPSKSFGGAFYANGWVAIGGIIKYRDNQTLQDFTYATNAMNACVTAGNMTPCQTDTIVNQYFNTTTGQATFNSTSGLQSSVGIRGVGFTELGLALSREFDIGNDSAWWGKSWGIGITPKKVSVTLFDYSASVNSANTSNAKDSDYTAKYSHFNFDLGLAKDYGNGWRAGFVVKNVIPHTYDFRSIMSGAPSGSAQINTGTMKLRPQARIGTSHATSWSTVAVDLDLTANDPAGLENKSQYLALGGELNAWDWAQVRLGYRANLKDSARSVTSVGVGLGPLDVTVAGSSKEFGASVALGFTF